MAKPLIQGKLGFFYDGGPNDKWTHDGNDWIPYYTPQYSESNDFEVDLGSPGTINVTIYGDHLNYIADGNDPTPINGGESVEITGTNIKIKGSNVNVFRASNTDITYAAINSLSSNMTSMNNMFEGCSSLLDMVVAEDSTYNIKSMASTWSSCSSMVTFSTIMNTINVTDLSRTWSSCYDLTNVPQINTSNVVSMHATYAWCSSLEEVPSNMDTRKVESFHYTFAETAITGIVGTIYIQAAKTLKGMCINCTNLLSSEVNIWNTAQGLSGVSFEDSFKGCTSLTSLPVSYFPRDAVIDSMYLGCTSIDEITVFEGNIKSAAYTFKGCTALTTIKEAREFKVQDANNMFVGCTSLNSIQLWNGMTLEGIQNAERMFAGCIALTTIPTQFDTSKISNMDSMFEDCVSLTNTQNISTESATNIDMLFKDCASLTTPPNILDLRSLKGGESNQYVFWGCTALTYAPNIINLPEGSLLNRFFASCPALTTIPEMTGIEGSLEQYFFSGAPITSPSSIHQLAIEGGYNFSSPITTPNKRNRGVLHTNKPNDPIEGFIALEGDMFTNNVTSEVFTYNGSIWESEADKIYATNDFDVDLVSPGTINVTIYGDHLNYIADGNTPTIINSGESVEIIGTNIKIKGSNVNVFRASNTDITDAAINSLSSNMTSMDNMFEDCYSLLDMTVVEDSTYNIKSMASTWASCSSMATFSTTMNTINVTDLSRTWSNCGDLTNVPQINTSKVVDMHSTYTWCSSLTEVPSNMDVRRVKDFHYTFAGTAITGIVGGLNVQQGLTFNGMFKECYDLITVDMSSTNEDNTGPVSYNKMFLDCNSLTDMPIINLKHGSIANEMYSNCDSLPIIETMYGDIKSANEMFYRCSSATEIKYSHLTAVNMDSMYDGCSSVTTIGSLDLSSTKSANGMFEDCTSITTLPVNLDTSNINRMENMFKDCTSLEDASIICTDNATILSSIFYNCTSLVTPPSILDLRSVVATPPGGYRDSNYMFINCTALTYAPNIINIPKGVDLRKLFEGCTSLITIPEISGDTTSLNVDFFDGTSSLVNPNSAQQTAIKNGYDYYSPVLTPNSRDRDIMHTSKPNDPIVDFLGREGDLFTNTVTSELFRYSNGKWYNEVSQRYFPIQFSNTTQQAKLLAEFDYTITGENHDSNITDVRIGVNGTPIAPTYPITVVVGDLISVELTATVTNQVSVINIKYNI